MICPVRDCIICVYLHIHLYISFRIGMQFQTCHHIDGKMLLCKESPSSKICNNKFCLGCLKTQRAEEAHFIYSVKMLLQPASTLLRMLMLVRSTLWTCHIEHSVFHLLCVMRHLKVESFYLCIWLHCKITSTIITGR